MEELRLGAYEGHSITPCDDECSAMAGGERLIEIVVWGVPDEDSEDE